MRMRMYAVLLMVVAGCGGKDADLDRNRLVPEGMRRTTVTMDDLHRPAPPTPTRSATADSAAARSFSPDSAAADVPAPAAEFAPTDAPPPVAEAGAGSPEPPFVPVGSSPAPRAGAFVVQAGAYKLQATADALAARLQDAGIPARIEPVSTAAGTLHRVVVPGLADRDAAAALVARLKQGLGVDAAVRTP